jgi:hypothetical protein
MANFPETPGLASFQADTFTPDRLIAGTRELRSEKKTLAAGTLARGAIVGLVLGTATAAAVAGNTGNGTMGAVTLAAGAKPGVYRVICIEPNTNLGTFAVEDPDGVIVGRANVGSAFAGPISFTIADGATDFVAGDAFTVTVANPGANVALCTAAATDGSQIPWGIVAVDANASAGAAEVLVYTHGDFNESVVTIGAGLTVAGAKEALRTRGLHLISVLAN